MNLISKLFLSFSFLLVISLLFLLFPKSQVKAQQRIPIYEIYEETAINTRIYLNRFDFSEIELRGVYTSPTGKVYNQIGYHAGNGYGGQTGEIWKIKFMPTEIGTWTYSFSWSDGNPGASGTFIAIDSNRPGRLFPANTRRWKLDTGDYIMPVMIPTRQWFKRQPTNHGINNFIRWASQTVRANLIGTTLVYFNHQQNEIPYIIGKEGIEFNVAMWDRLNSHYNYMAERAIGQYIMFYADGIDNPSNYGITACSKEEVNLFKYAIARYAPYPSVIWDTGENIQQTRGGQLCNGYDWVEWFTQFFNQNDPWQHPVGNRSGGGMGSYSPPSATFYSDGSETLPPHTTVVSNWNSRQVPSIYTDRWRENFGRGNFNPDKIRQAVWEVGLVGGTGVYVGGNNNDGYFDEVYYNDFIAAPQVGHAVLFFRNALLNFGNLSPHDELVTSGSSVILSADPGKEYVAYLAQGGSVSINISPGTYISTWYDPRNGSFTEEVVIEGGSILSFTPPGTSDWVLHLVKTVITPTPIPYNPADANSDWHVDGSDYIIWHNFFGQSQFGREFGDFNEDNTVDIIDYPIWIFNYPL
jgi:hypothetical protein